MNPPKCTSSNFVNFLISTYQACSCSEASRCLLGEPESIAHDSVKWLLERQSHHTEALYNEAKRLIRTDEGVLVIDDSTLDKPYSHQIELVTRHGSGKHHRVVQGINLILTIWTDGSAIVPVDFRIYNPDKDGKNKNDHFRHMLRAADERKFQPNCVIFDSRYSELFIPIKNQNTELPLSLMLRNPIENRSRILDGISRSITAALSSVRDREMPRP